MSAHTAEERLRRVLGRLAAWPAVEEEALAASGSAWLVGGSLRDALLGRVPRPGAPLDLDLAVPERAREAASRIARRLKGTCFVLDEKTRVWRVAARRRPSQPELQVDVGEFQGATLEADLARRDFTIDALALPLPIADGRLHDPHGALADLAARRLRATHPKVFAEDPLRVLRAFRLAALLDLTIEAQTLALASAARGALRRCAGERIRTELVALLSVPAAPWLRLMDEAGVLTALLEELEPARRCAEVYYGAGGVLKHSLDTVARMDFLLANLERAFPDLADGVRRHLEGLPGGAVHQEALLRLAGLLHDVAKPDCARRVGGRLRFFGHDSVGAAAAGRILRRLRFSREEEELVSTVVLHHLRPGNLAANEIISDKAIWRFFRDLGERGIPQLLVCWADHASYLAPAVLERILPWADKDPFGPDRPKRVSTDTLKTLHHLQVIHTLLGAYFRRPETSRPERLLGGHDVMRALKLPPGRRVGEILLALEEAQAEGRVLDRAGALRFVRSLPVP